MTKKAVLVIGMHRSGTSALSGELSGLGVFMGRRLFKAQKGVNDKGFWENAELVKLNERILDSVNSSWDDPIALLKHKPEESLSANLESKANALIRNDYGDKSLWGMKDPRVAMLLPFWRKALKQADVECHYILIIRHPLEVAASLTKRDGFSQNKGLMLWLNYNFQCFEETLGCSRVIVDFQSLLSNPLEIRKKLAKSFSIVLPQQTDSFVDKGLRRQQASPAKTQDTLLQTMSMSLYRAIVEDDRDAVSQLRVEYQTYLQKINSVMVEHLESVRKSEVHFRNLFERAYFTYSWKLMWPFRRIEMLLKGDK